MIINLFIILALLYIFCKIILIYSNQQCNSPKVISDKSILKIFFATQTGNAEKLANRLSDILQKTLKIHILVIDFDNFEFNDFLEINIALFIISTCGDGEVTDNSRFFISWLENLPKNSLFNLKYSIFGLGSREYEHFNEASKIFYHLFTRLGATLFSPIVYGDSQYDYDPDFNKWVLDLIPNLALYYDINEYELPKLSKSIYKSWRDVEGVENELVYLTSKESQVNDLNSLSLICRRQAKCVRTSVLKKKKLSKNDVFHIDFVTVFKFDPADNIAILYRTNEEVVNWWVDRLKVRFDLDRLISFKPIDSSKKFIPPFPIPCTLNDALTLYCDLTSLPQPSELLKFTSFLTEEDEIRIVTSIVNDEKIFNLEKDVKMNFMEFVEVFMSSAVFDISGFLQIIPKKNLRQYTISSSPLYESSFSITVKKTWERLHPLRRLLTKLDRKGLIPRSIQAKLDEFKSRKREFNGACSNYLINLNIGDEVYLMHMPSKFTIDLIKPMIMIATGTGIAPFRSFWEHLSLLNIKNDSIIFYGCRYKDEWLYKDEMDDVNGKLVVKKLFLAFSREQDKIYVQDRMMEKKYLILKHIFEDGGKIYVCGNREMGKSVKGILISIINDHMGLSNGDWYLDDMVKNGTYVYEVWS